MVYYESNYLCHYGLKGMKWGQRRWQNADGTFNAAGKARYFGENSDHRPDSVKEAKQKYKAARKGVFGNGRFRPGDKSQRSKNWQINRMGGRKINADYETRRARGEALTKAGRSDLGAVGRHFARNLMYGAAAGVAASALATVGQGALNNGHYGVGIGAGHAALILKGAAGLYTISSIIKTYQDISDMHTYKDSKSGRK